MRRDIKKVPTLRGRTVVNLFYESSTRTSSSFELAAKRSLRRPRLGQGVGLRGRQGRVAEGHGRDALGLRPLGDRRPPSARRGRPAHRGLDRGRRRQRRRRQARASEPGAARRLHAAPPARRPRRQEDLDRRRRPPQPGGPLEPDGLPEARRRGDGLRPADPDPPRHRAARLRGGARPRRAAHRRHRLRPAPAARADARGVPALDPRVRDPLPDQLAQPRPAPAPDAPGAGQPRRRALGRGDRFPAVADHRAGRLGPRGSHGDPLRADRGGRQPRRRPRRADR